MINRSKDRIKQTGEVFTPIPLVVEILSKLPQEVWTDHKKTFLDNSCGDGNFLVQVVTHKIFYGSTIEQALKTTHGVDLMQDNVERARIRVLIHAHAADIFFDKFLIEVGGRPIDLTPNEEDMFERTKEFEDVVNKYYKIVKKNIVCHDALTYDYSFK